MHNGVFKTLEQVVDFYNNGGGKGLKIAPKNQTLPFEKLQLSVVEKHDIIAFLRTLTDTLQVVETSFHRNL
jgi:cytochrome c peroxidase